MLVLTFDGSNTYTVDGIAQGTGAQQGDVGVPIFVPLFLLGYWARVQQDSPLAQEWKIL